MIGFPSLTMSPFSFTAAQLSFHCIDTQSRHSSFHRDDEEQFSRLSNSEFQLIEDQC